MKFPADRNRKIHVILHGGFGNQLFQYLKAKLEQEEHPNSIIYIHTSCLSDYKVGRYFELKKITSSQDIIVNDSSLMCKFRIVKVINKIKKKEVIFKVPFGPIIIDGYYQDIYSYIKYNKKIISETINYFKLKFPFKIHQRNRLPKLVHLRLTDFFKDKNDSYNYAISYIKNINEYSEIITDDESMVEEIIAALKKEKMLKIIKTQDFKADNIIEIISNYKTIESNGSTLAFWGAILYGLELKTTNANQNLIWNHLNINKNLF